LSRPDWLRWAREVQAIAQTGLAYDPPVYDRDRYRALQDLAVEMMESLSGADPAAILALFDAQTGYATPKIDVRAAVFQDGKLLLVRETSDHHRWTLPGGWADVNLTPAENAVKEVLEETGFHVNVDRLVSVLDRDRAGHPPQAFHAYKLTFLCSITGGAATPSDETSEIAFFGEDDLPTDLSINRTLPEHLHRMFAHHRSQLPPDFN